MEANTYKVFGRNLSELLRFPEVKVLRATEAFAVIKTTENIAESLSRYKYRLQLLSSEKQRSQLPMPMKKDGEMVIKGFFNIQELLATTKGVSHVHPIGQSEYFVHLETPETYESLAQNDAVSSIVPHQVRRVGFAPSQPLLQTSSSSICANHARLCFLDNLAREEATQILDAKGVRILNTTETHIDLQWQEPLMEQELGCLKRLFSIETIHIPQVVG